MTRLAQLVARMEGFPLPGKIPTTHHNPADLRHSPHSTHAAGAPDAIGMIDTDQHGWEDAERQFALVAARGWTLREFVQGRLDAAGQLEGGFAPLGDGANDPPRYLAFLAAGLGVAPDTPMSEVLKIPAV